MEVEFRGVEGESHEGCGAWMSGDGVGMRWGDGCIGIKLMTVNDFDIPGNTKLPCVNSSFKIDHENKTIK